MTNKIFEAEKINRNGVVYFDTYDEVITEVIYFDLFPISDQVVTSRFCFERIREQW